MGAALLDLEQPDKVLYRTKNYLHASAENYETQGDVPNVVFPCAALTSDDGRVAIYYGAADTSVAIAYGYISEIIDEMKHNSL